MITSPAPARRRDGLRVPAPRLGPATLLAAAGARCGCAPSDPAVEESGASQPDHAQAGEQIGQFEDVFTGNNRPMQPLGGRTVVADTVRVD